MSARRLLPLLLIAAAVVVGVRALVVQSFVVPTPSMEPTVQPGDRLVVSRLAYRTGAVARGDVVVFDGSGLFAPEPAPPRNDLAALGRGIASVLGAPVGRSDFVKRVIGLPGERVTCCDAQGRITVDGRPLDEPYLAPGDAPSETRFDVRVPENSFWVLGDHRSDSADSRAHLGDPGGGMVPLDRLIGKVVALWWPVDRAGGLSSPVSSQGEAPR